ncbi:hypothetical protein EDD17DRAFT_1555363, partial [Pisolithus thermaeus]
GGPRTPLPSFHFFFVTLTSLALTPLLRTATVTHRHPSKDLRRIRLYICTGLPVLFMSTCAHLFIPTSRHICIACTYAKRLYTYPMIKAAAASTKLVRSKVSPKPKKREKRKGRKSRRLYLVGAKLELPRHERSPLGTRRAVRIADHSIENSSIDGWLHRTRIYGIFASVSI